MLTYSPRLLGYIAQSLLTDFTMIQSFLYFVSCLLVVICRQLEAACHW